MSDPDGPCTCWITATLHDGHCCMRVAGAGCHQDAGMAMHNRARGGSNG